MDPTIPRPSARVRRVPPPPGPRTEPAAASPAEVTVPRQGAPRSQRQSRTNVTAEPTADPQTDLPFSESDFRSDDGTAPASYRSATGPGGPGAERLSGFAKFRISDELGRGGMGAVHLAEDVELRRELAIKILLKPGDQQAVAHFMEEAQITGQLQHPNIVPVHEMGIDPGGRPWLAMKRVEGVSLAEWIHDRDDDGPLTGPDIATIIGIFSRICDGMTFAHDRRVIHRDLKPANVMVGSCGEVLVLDWGLARPLDATPAPGAVRPSPASGGSGRNVRSTRRDTGLDLTVDGDVMGTPAYMSPEQARGDTDRLDERSDIFSLGGILYCMLTGENPYEGDSVMQVVASAYQWKLVEPRTRTPKRRIPAELASIVMRAMARHPRDRYQTIGGLQADLDAFETYRPVAAHRAGPLQRLVKFTRRHPVGVIASAVTAVFLSVFGVVVSVLLAQQAKVAHAEAEQRQRAETATLAAEVAVQKRLAAERDTRDAELKALVAEGRLQDIAEKLGVEVRQAKDAAIREFRVRMVQLKSGGLLDHEVYERISGSPDANRYLEAFRRLFVAHRELGTPVTRDDRYQFAELLLKVAHSPDEAVPILTACVRKDPEFGAGWNLLAQAYGALGRTEDALDAFDRAVRYQPRSAVTCYNRGTLLYHQELRDRGLADFAEAIRLRPSFGEAYVNRGQLHYISGRAELGLADANSALRYGLNTVLAHRLRGLTNLYLANPAAAVDDFTAAMGLAPRDAELVFLRGTAREAINDLNGAMRDFEGAFRLDPTMACALAGASRVFLYGQDVARAAEFARRACALDESDIESRHARANANVAVRDHAAALPDYDFVLERRPSSLAYYQRGVCRIATGDLEGAVEDFTRNIESANPLAQAYVNRGAVIGRTNPAAVIDDARAAIALDGDLWQAHNLLGRALEASQPPDLRGAIAAFARARNLLRRQPNGNQRAAAIARHIQELRARLDE